MKKNKLLKFLLLIIALLFAFNIKAQRGSVDSLNKSFLNWYNLDHKKDKVEGASVNKAYNKLLKGKTAKKKIIVAVIDGGVDTAHVDLKGKIWKNTKEIPNNKIDDDDNGYVDDVAGWNFIGNSKGEDIVSENEEFTRIYKKFNPMFKDINSEDFVPASQKKDYESYIICKAKYDEDLAKYTSEKKDVEAYEKKLDDTEAKIKDYFKKDKFTTKEVKDISTSDTSVTNAQKTLLNIYKIGITHGMLKGMKRRDSLNLYKYLNLDFNPRTIVGDDPENIKDTKYGNNDVKGPNSEHGTLASGVIAAIRNNGIGIDGIVDDVEIMPIRVVPDGDERDKDVALAIKYAVDNGANIINMSFGKDYSPQKEFVDDAIKYACDHNVLLVHAAGNEGMNSDSTEHYPSKKFNNGTFAKSMITVGASNIKLDENFAAFFSNYGQSVDLFAPGVNIISLYTGNKYDKTNGTSFSCPVVSGVAALVWSYFPELTAEQLKNVLLSSVTSHSNLKVYKPNTKSKDKQFVLFGSLCKTGGTLNAYNAIKAAKKMVKKNKKK